MPMNARKFLHFKYGGFADARCKNTDRDHPIAVHEKHIGDVPYQCCGIRVNIPVHDTSRIRLALENAPFDTEIEQWVKKHDAKIEFFDDRARIVIEIDISDVRVIKSLAGKINGIPKRARPSGTIVPTRNYSWLCQRINKSLRKLAANLEELAAIGIAVTPVSIAAPKPATARKSDSPVPECDSFDLTDPRHWDNLSF